MPSDNVLKEKLYPDEKGYRLTQHGESVARIKRFLEYLTLDPSFKEKFQERPEQTIADFNLGLDFETVRALLEPAYKENSAFDERRWYCEFVQNKIKSRNYMQQEGCQPADLRFAKWRERQVNRCWVEMGMRNENMIHTPLIFELSDGCSVGCPFCGVNAGKLCSVFRYTEENAMLFRGILEEMKELLGAAAGSGTCYYATEPLDNPDYEKWVMEYYDVLGVIPQITTAVAMRDVARTKALLKQVQSVYLHVDRFSVLSLDIFRKIMESFTPEELLYVELLPQFTEAPTNNFSAAGRNRSDNADYSTGTICCVSGLVINMCKKEMRLVTPCGVDNAHPTGELVLETGTFADLKEFKIRLAEIMEKEMKRVDYDGEIAFYPYLEYGRMEQGFEIHSTGGYSKHFVGMECENHDVFGEVGDLIVKGGYSANNISVLLEEKFEIDPAYSFYAIGKLYQFGCIDVKTHIQERRL